LREYTDASICTNLTYDRHIASPLVIGVQDIANDLLKPAIQGTVGILQSALSSPTVKAIVVTSSFGSVVDPKLGWRAGYTYSAVSLLSSVRKFEAKLAL
jgi:NADPH-dependent methylglyoxal reductase